MTGWQTQAEREAAISVHPEIIRQGKSPLTWDARAQEFDRLVEATACRLVHSWRVPLRQLQPGTLLGSGQVAQLKQLVQAHAAGVVFVDHPLSPVQQRNLEKGLNAKVVDRTGLILEIFAARARTREGVLQVELASLNYQLGRLVRSWTHLERQRGGFGFLGGPGERQIELDRRMIRTRIRALERELAKVRRMRATQRGGRKRKSIPTVALVGYTNAGKSTLFNRLSQAKVYAADKLFATLDPTLRILNLAPGQRVMLADTVGFVQELPHELIEAFKATLEEVTEADLILHVQDAADPMRHEQAQVVRQTLQQLGLVGDSAPPIIDVLNKIDQVPDMQPPQGRWARPNRIAISARTGQGIDVLKARLRKWLDSRMREARLILAPSDGRTLAFCHARGVVLASSVDENGMIHLHVRMRPADLGRIRRNHQGRDELMGS
ncbi:MAG: GTPase HflX [Zetaproteobacteria bacterium]|nr:MAG: GTPase HflX [Zetaproteobacteria bacterium]